MRWWWSWSSDHCGVSGSAGGVAEVRRAATGLHESPQALEVPVPAFAAQVVAGKLRAQADVIEVELRARDAARCEAKGDLGAHPLVASREGHAGGVGPRDTPHRLT